MTKKNSHVQVYGHLFIGLKHYVTHKSKLHESKQQYGRRKHMIRQIINNENMLTVCRYVQGWKCLPVHLSGTGKFFI